MSIVNPTDAPVVELSVDSIAALRLLPGGIFKHVLVDGYSTAGDGGGGLFRWSSADASADNLGTIIAPSAGTGRWNRIYDQASEFIVKWFGAKGDAVTDDSAAFQAAINAVQVAGGTLYIPPSSGLRYLIGTALTIDVTKSYIRIVGAGGRMSVLRYTGAGSAFGPTGGTGSFTVAFEAFDIQLTNTAAIALNFNQFISSTVRTMRIAWAGAGTNGGTAISSKPSAAANSPFFNVIDDLTSDSCTFAIDLDSTVSQAPNAWRINNLTVLSPQAANTIGGIRLANAGPSTVTNTSIISPYFDQIGGVGITLGATADRTRIICPTMETAQGGTMFSINATANRTTIVGPTLTAGTAGTAALGVRGVLLGQWDEGLVRSSSAAGSAIGAFIHGRTSPAYGATVAIDTTLGDKFDVVATNGVAFTISSPINPVEGQRITVKVKNTSGGVLGVITWGAAYKMLAFTSPTAGNNCALDFEYDAGSGQWYQISPQSLQIPN